MKVYWCRVAILALLLIGSFGCRSECRKLCDRQQKCSAVSNEENTRSMLNPEKQIELCERVCEAAVNDTKLEKQMQLAVKCAEQSCGEFTACINAASKVSE